jgi:magnesium-transporting ATPase (P-type)
MKEILDNFNIYESNLHFCIAYAFGIFCLISLFMIKGEPKEKHFLKVKEKEKKPINYKKLVASIFLISFLIVLCIMFYALTKLLK